VQLGFENRKKAIWAAVLGVLALIVFAYEFIPMLTESSAPSSNAQAAPPQTAPRVSARGPSRGGRGTKADKKPRGENLDPTLKLDLLAMSEKNQYQGNGRNIFVSQAEDIPMPIAPGHTDTNATVHPQYQVPQVQGPPPIPLKFYGFASKPGEPKKIFLKLNDDVFVAGEGEIVDRRYKVIRITNTSVEIQDVVNSGPPQSIPLTQG
jgi:hypothetical protein